MPRTADPAAGPPPARQRNRRGEGERLRDELIAAAGRIYERTGSEEGMSLRAVATEAGIAAPSIYRHFADKHALVQAVQAARFDDLRAHIDHAAADVTDPVDELRTRCLAYCTYADQHPGNYRVMFAAVPTTQPATLDELPGAQVIVELIDNIDRAASTGTSGPFEPFTAAVLLWSTLHGIVSLRVAKPAFPWPATTTLVDQALHALCAAPLPTVREPPSRRRTKGTRS
jgi:AcrR family transcriptional regulator